MSTILWLRFVFTSSSVNTNHLKIHLKIAHNNILNSVQTPYNYFPECVWYLSLSFRSQSIKDPKCFGQKRLYPTPPIHSILTKQVSKNNPFGCVPYIQMKPVPPRAS
ncbi:hypothetical protein EYC84_009683 [Monilinia fructicola]|uniref:Uncharacterized protein n=1 Tax=Monilinia fructicola TaxID=38448 RepID=A0A5M9JAS0_MONFR|nr:hypothetical protein EYC84_009683 [Monilinia fructicola]